MPPGSERRGGRRSPRFSGSGATDVNWESASQRTSHAERDPPPPQHERAWSPQRSSTSPQRTIEVSESHAGVREKTNAKERGGDVRLAGSGLNRKPGASARNTGRLKAKTFVPRESGIGQEPGHGAVPIALFRISSRHVIPLHIMRCQNRT